MSETHPTAVTANRSESELIAAILAGNTELFHTLIQPYELTVYRMALSLMHSESDVEDVAQEAFLKAFRNLKLFRGEAKFSTWLISITLNEARSRLRRTSAHPMDSIDAATDEDSHVSPALLRDWREIPSEALEREEIRSLLRAAIEQLKPIYREVVLLRDMEEMSIEETAAMLEISPNLVKVRLHRARTMLQKTLAPQLQSLNPKRRWFPWF